MLRDKCEVWAPAKINLDLRVLGRRPDGFHEIDTTFVAVDLYDHLRFVRSEGECRLALSPDSAVSPTAADFPLDERNLVLRAVRLWEQVTGVRIGIEITVTKSIPSAAGLGGGSSDAAATLWAINHMFGFDKSDAELGRMGASLGSDVPFFLGGAAARGRGRGEILEPIDLYWDWWAVLLCPPYRSSTPEVYAGLSLTEFVRNSRFDARSDEEGFFAALRRSHNDLEEVVVRRIPALLALREGLLANGAVYAAVSGSGPTIFGVFRRPPDEGVLARLSVLGDGNLRVCLVRPVATSQALKTN